MVCVKTFAAVLLVAQILFCPPASLAARELMIVGNDEKVGWDDKGAPVYRAPGRDTVAIVDIGTNPEEPRILASLPLANSVIGPPTNLAITPDGALALAANPMDWERKDGAWEPVPGETLYVIDLEAEPPALLDTLRVGKQPSGVAVSRAGDLALVAHRADNSIGVLAIDGKRVTLVDRVDVGESVAAVAIAPDGRRALAAKFSDHKVALLDIEGRKVTYGGTDLPVGLWPYNVQITPDGRLALVANNGNRGFSDGHVDTVGVIDLEADPPRVIDQIPVGDAPEGLAIGPTGEIAVVLLLKGSGFAPKGSWYSHRNGSVEVLRIDGKSVTRAHSIEVGGMPEGVVFGPDGRTLYVGNFADGDVSILRVEGTRVVDTGKRFTLPGRPAAMRGRLP